MPSPSALLILICVRAMHEEFGPFAEAYWQNLMKQFPIPWVTEYLTRNRKFFLVYNYHDVFCANIFSSQRAEVSHSKLKRCSGHRFPTLAGLVKYTSGFNQDAEGLRLELLQDIEGSVRSATTSFPVVEKELRKAIAPFIFNRFAAELQLATSYFVVELKRDEDLLRGLEMLEKASPQQLAELLRHTPASSACFLHQLCSQSCGGSGQHPCFELGVQHFVAYMKGQAALMRVLIRHPHSGRMMCSCRLQIYGGYPCRHIIAFLMRRTLTADDLLGYFHNHWLLQPVSSAPQSVSSAAAGVEPHSTAASAAATELPSLHPPFDSAPLPDMGESSEEPDPWLELRPSISSLLRPLYRDFRELETGVIKDVNIGYVARDLLRELMQKWPKRVGDRLVLAALDADDVSASSSTAKKNARPMARTGYAAAANRGGKRVKR